MGPAVHGPRPAPGEGGDGESGPETASDGAAPVADATPDVAAGANGNGAASAEAAEPVEVGASPDGGE